MLADLHSHTYFSDGELSPEALIARAVANNVDFLAITDHDTTAAFEHIDTSTLPSTFQLIHGVEISCLWENKEIHIVGIGLDLANEGLQTLLQRQQQLRRERAEQIDKRLQLAGHTGLMRYLEQLPCQAISRNHIAQFLIDGSIARSKDHAFKSYLGDKGKYTAAAQWCEIPVAVATIQAAGGIAILAHPNRYSLNKVKLRRLISEFAECGGQGVEVSYSNLDPDKMAHMGTLCIENDLWASTGSDFHTPKNQWMDVGRFRHLPAHCAQKAIWLHPDWPGRSDTSKP
ncbi:MAG: PHP domain-containing protein [Gammaproteobacteria bacterium]